MADAGAPIGQQVDQAFGCQDFQRLAQRGAGDAEHFAQLALRNPVAIRNVAFDQIVPKPHQNFAVQRWFLARGRLLHVQRRGGLGRNRRFHGRRVIENTEPVDRKFECNILIDLANNECINAKTFADND